MKKTAVKKSAGKKTAVKKFVGKAKFGGKFGGKKFAKKPATGRTADQKAPPKKKGGPLRSKKPGRNQVARPRVLSPVKALSPGKKKALRPETPAAPAVQVAARPVDGPDPSRPRALDIAQAGLDKKAEDVLVLDVRGLTSYADYFVLMTADSDRQAGAIADAVDEKLKAQGASKVGVEGYESGRWILVDYGDVVAHVFSREARGFYDLEGLWADAPRFAVQD
jgi:ribosome-associated protein